MTSALPFIIFQRVSLQESVSHSSLKVSYKSFLAKKCKIALLTVLTIQFGFLDAIKTGKRRSDQHGGNSLYNLFLRLRGRSARLLISIP